MSPKVATLEVEIGAKIDQFEKSIGKVTKNLKGMEKRLDGVSRGAKKSTTAFSGMARKLIAVGVAYFGARGIFRMAKSFLDVATSVETYRLRLEAMLGSQEAATDAMAYFKEVAAKVPFTLEEVIEAGVKVQAFGADLKAWTPIMADLAAFMGVTLPEAASALGRAFAGGAGAADIFRERGILQVIRDFAKMEKGIDDITKLSLPEFRDVMFEAFAGAESKVAGTADKLATTWVGTVSMLQDKWFKFRDAVMKTKIFELLKEGLTSFNESLDEFVKAGELDKWAKNTAIAVIDAFKIITKGVEGLMLSFQTLKASIAGAVKDLTVYMREYIEKLIIGFGLLEKLGVPVKGILKDLITEWANLSLEESNLNKTIEETTTKMANILTFFDRLKEKLNATKEAIKETKEATKELTEKTEEFKLKMGVVGEDVWQWILVLNVAQKELKSLNFEIIKLSEKGMLMFGTMIDAFTGGVMNALDAFHRFGEEGGSVLETLGGVIHGFVAEAINALKQFTMSILVESAKIIFAKQAEAIAGVIASVMKTVKFPFSLLIVGGAMAAVSALFAGLKPKKFEAGGYVPEETLAHLHPGERVLSAAEVRREARPSDVPGMPPQKIILPLTIQIGGEKYERQIVYIVEKKAKLGDLTLPHKVII